MSKRSVTFYDYWTIKAAAQNRPSVYLHLESRVKNKDSRYSMGPLNLCLLCPTLVPCDASKFPSVQQEVNKLQRPVTLCSTLNLRFGGEASSAFYSFSFSFPQPQTASRRWRQVEPLQTPPRPSQRRAGQAHQPAALQRGGQVSAGQAVGAAPQRGLPEGQELLQR